MVFSYVLYLLGKLEYKVDSVRLNKIISKWFFMSAITYFYTGPTESEVERQFADLRNVHTADEFIEYLEKTISSRFTDDYFKLTLPNELNTSSAISPAWYGYIASQIVLNNPMLFSTSALTTYLLPGASGTKNAVDKHHIFPKNYLTQIGYTTDHDRNQAANIGAAAISEEDGKLHPTAAGMLMFGDEYNIVRHFPEYFLDYREELDPTTRWSDRLQSSSGEWSGNVCDFYFRVYNKIIKDIKVPFKMVGGERIDDTPVHKALREALANCLINADYHGLRGVVIRKEPDKQGSYENV